MRAPVELLHYILFPAWLQILFFFITPWKLLPNSANMIFFRFLPIKLLFKIMHTFNLLTQTQTQSKSIYRLSEKVSHGQFGLHRQSSHLPPQFQCVGRRLGLLKWPASLPAFAGDAVSVGVLHDQSGVVGGHSSHQQQQSFAVCGGWPAELGQQPPPSLPPTDLSRCGICAR